MTALSVTFEEVREAVEPFRNDSDYIVNWDDDSRIEILDSHTFKRVYLAREIRPGRYAVVIAEELILH